MNNYELKKQMKIDRAHDLAIKAKRESTSRFDAAQQTLSFIPFGQPILVGHHSEGRHRRDLERIDNNMRKSIECDEKAKYYTDRARRLENDTVISSDDPAALDKLRAKLDNLQRSHEMMKAINAIVKNKKLSDAEKIDQINATGFTDRAVSLLIPDRLGRVGFPDYSLSNSNQNMKSVKDRIAQLEKRSTQETTERELNGVRIVDNVEENRLQAFFPGKPSDEIRGRLKHSGFRWSPSNGCWQAYRNRWALDRLNEICESMVQSIEQFETMDHNGRR